MSDVWQHYFANIDGHTASILFDEGISAEIRELTHLQSVKVHVRLIEWNDMGLPTTEESERLDGLDEHMEKALQANQGMLLGRVTSNKERWIMALVDEDFEFDKLKQLATSAGYEARVWTDPDPERSLYWDDLYPTPDDRRVMGDMQVLGNLRKNGDIHEAEREVDHWAYFDNKESAEIFTKWLNERNYKDITMNEHTEDARHSYCVRSKHIGTMLLGDITHHTLAQHRKATELGGEYDGWETFIVRSKD